MGEMWDRGGGERLDTQDTCTCQPQSESSKHTPDLAAVLTYTCDNERVTAHWSQDLGK